MFVFLVGRLQINLGIGCQVKLGLASDALIPIAELVCSLARCWSSRRHLRWQTLPQISLTLYLREASLVYWALDTGDKIPTILQLQYDKIYTTINLPCRIQNMVSIPCAPRYNLVVCLLSKEHFLESNELSAISR
jgi:hypothetical protein